LIEQGHANVEAVDENGQTPLFAAASSGLESSRKIVHYLVETCRANVNVVDNEAETPCLELA
jgi:ankyrin repeat protein